MIPCNKCNGETIPATFKESMRKVKELRGDEPIGDLTEGETALVDAMMTPLVMGPFKARKCTECGEIMRTSYSDIGKMLLSVEQLPDRPAMIYKRES